jgi:hypothetical protein
MQDLDPSPPPSVNQFPAQPYLGSYYFPLNRTLRSGAGRRSLGRSTLDARRAARLHEAFARESHTGLQLMVRTRIAALLIVAAWAVLIARNLELAYSY